MWQPGPIHQPLLHCESNYPQSTHFRCRWKDLWTCCLSVSYSFLSLAKLLRQGYHHRVPEKDCDLLKAAHRRQWRDHLWLQIPPGGEQDPLPVWNRELPWDTKLVDALLPHLPTASLITLLRAYIETKPPSDAPSAPLDGLIAVLTIPRKQKRTHLHFSCTLHSLGNVTSQCVRVLCNLAFEYYEGVFCFSISSSVAVLLDLIG